MLLTTAPSGNAVKSSITPSVQTDGFGSPVDKSIKRLQRA